MLVAAVLVAAVLIAVVLVVAVLVAAVLVAVVLTVVYSLLCSATYYDNKISNIEFLINPKLVF